MRRPARHPGWHEEGAHRSAEVPPPGDSGAREASVPVRAATLGALAEANKLGSPAPSSAGKAATPVAGRKVAFARETDLRAAAHEAAHSVQQKAVQLAGGIDGGADDPHERHADEVAEAVVSGRSAEPLLDQVAGGGASGSRVVQRNPKPGAKATHQGAPVPARGDYLIERTADGSYVFVFNTFDRNGWSEPVLTGLRYYMQQAFPGVGDGVIRTVFTELKVKLDRHSPTALPDDHRYELQVDVKLHRDVVAWMAAHHPEFSPQAPKLGGGGLHERDAGGAGKGVPAGAPPHEVKPHGTTMTSDAAGTSAGKPADKVSAEVEQARALYERLRKTFPAAIELGSRSAWPELLAYVSDHAQELQKLLHDSGRSASLEDLRKLLAQFRTHEEAKDGDSAGEVGGHTAGKLGGSEVGTKDGDVRTTREGGIKDGSIYGEPGGDAHGWHRWAPKGQLQLQPTQPTYVTGSSVQAELAWDLSVHPEAGQILLPNHCTYAWTVYRGGKLIDSDGRSVLADDRRARLHLGKEPGMYEITVTATSRHFKAARHRFSSSVVVRAVSEQAFDRAAFDDTQLGGQDAAFSRDERGALHLEAGQTARTTQEEIGSLDLTRGGIDALAAQGKITGSDHDVAIGQIDKQREALLEIQDKVKDGTPYLVRGSFVSREDSSTTPLRLLMHVLRRSESGGVARYELILHDTTFGEAVQNPGSSAWRLDHDSSAAVYRRLEAEALDEMAEHFHAHNDSPKGTVHLAAQRLASDAVWEKTLDTDNGRKTAKKILCTAALIGGAAMLIVPGGSIVAAGLMVVTSAAGVASVALEVEDRIAKEGYLKLDRRLAMDVLQVVAVSLPFGTLTRTFAEASLVGKGRFLLCMTGLDVAQGFVIASDVKEQLRVIEANTAVGLAGATSDEQRTAIHAERDRRVAEVIGGAVVNGGFLLVSLGHGIKRAIAITRAGAKFTVREPVRDLVKQGRERMEQALSTDTFEHEGQRVQLTDEERRYLEHEVATHESEKPSEATKPADSAAKPAESSHERGSDDANATKPPASPGETHPTSEHPTESTTAASDKPPATEKPPEMPAELLTLGADRAKAITDHLEEPLTRQLLSAGGTAADLDAIANTFTAGEVRGYLGEGLVPSAIGELATLDVATRAKLLGPGNLTGAAAHELLAAVGKDGLHTLAKTLAGPEIVALRGALADDAMLSRLVGAGGAKLRDVAAEIGAVDVKATAKMLTPERFADLADAGLSGTQLRALAADFTSTELAILETVMSRQQLSAFYASPDMGNVGLRVIHDCVHAPNIKGLKDWVYFASAKTSVSDWRRMLGELRAALRAIKADPSEIVEVDADANTPTKTGQYSPQGTPQKAKSFDQAVKDSTTGAVKRSVEITSVNSPVIGPGDITDGIRHGTEKIGSRLTTPVDAPGHVSGTPLPIPGSKELVIQIEFFRGEYDPATQVRTQATVTAGTAGTMPAPASGRKSVVFDGRGGYEYHDYAPQRPAGATFKPSKYHGDPNPGSIQSNVLTNLNSSSYLNAALLDRICLVGFDGIPIAEYVRDGSTGTWSPK